MTKILTSLVFVLAATTACKKKPADAPPPEGSAMVPTGSATMGSAAMGSDTMGSAAMGSAAASGSATGSADGSGSAAAVVVPTEQDFEKKSQAKITDKNLEDQVQAMEKEVGK